MQKAASRVLLVGSREDVGRNNMILCPSSVSHYLLHLLDTGDWGEAGCVISIDRGELAAGQIYQCYICDVFGVNESVQP